MRRANSRQAELLELKLELEPPPQLVKHSALRLSPAPAASRADLARNWRRVRETSLIGNSPHPFDPQHPSPAQRNSFYGGGVSLRRRLSTKPLTTNCSENTIVLQQFEFWQEEPCALTSVLAAGRLDRNRLDFAILCAGREGEITHRRTGCGGGIEGWCATAMEPQGREIENSSTASSSSAPAAVHKPTLAKVYLALLVSNAATKVWPRSARRKSSRVF
jgi:hypothetical protein